MGFSGISPLFFTDNFSIFCAEAVDPARLSMGFAHGQSPLSFRICHGADRLTTQG
jgi:hypothetical protein